MEFSDKGQRSESGLKGTKVKCNFHLKTIDVERGRFLWNIGSYLILVWRLKFLLQTLIKNETNLTSMLFRPESLSVHYSGYLGSKAELKDSHNTGERKKLIARLIKNALHNLSINERSNTAAGISTNQVFERVHGVKLMKTSLELCKRFTNLQPTKYLLHHSFAVIDSDNWYWSIEHDQHYIQIQRSREIDNIQYYRSGIAR